MKYKVSNQEHTEIIEASTKWEAEADFINKHYPTTLDDDLSDLEIEVQEALRELVCLSEGKD